MRITTRTRYAIRALYDLAFHRLGQAARPRRSRSGQKIPLRFLEQILQDLRKAGIVEARRGPRGGYALARRRPQISLADVLRAVRGPLEEMFGFDAPANGNGEDVPAAVWTDVRTQLVDVLERATLAGFRRARRGRRGAARRLADDDVLHLMNALAVDGEHPGPHRPHAAGAAAPAAGRGRRGRRVVKCEQMNPGGSRQGSHGAGDGRGGRARGAPRPRALGDRRGDVGEHRHRPGAGRGGRRATG